MTTKSDVAAPSERERFIVPLEVKFAEGAEAKAGTFTGYGAIFGNLDAYGDVIQKGAFKATLKDWRKRHGKLPKMLLQHGGMFLTDTCGIPIGKWTAMEEDDTGLRVEGELLALDTDLMKRVYAAMKAGELDGLSIGYVAREPVVYGTKPDEPRRTLKKVDLWEVSVVTFPANDEARVGAVKGAPHQNDIRSFERFLRDEGGFSCAAAKAIAAHGFKAASDPRDEDGGLSELRGPLERWAAAFASTSR